MNPHGESNLIVTVWRSSAKETNDLLYGKPNGMRDGNEGIKKRYWLIDNFEHRFRQNVVLTSSPLLSHAFYQADAPTTAKTDKKAENQRHWLTRKQYWVGKG